MTTLNQFFPSGGSGSGGAETTSLISAEIVVVGGGTYGYGTQSCAFRCPVVAAPCGPTYNYCSVNAGSGGATIHAQNYLLKRGEICPVQVGSAATVVGTHSYSSCGGGGFYTSCFRISGYTAAWGSSYFGGVSELCAAGACTQGIPSPTPYQPNNGTICVCRGGVSVNDTNSYDSIIVTNSVITRNILGPTVSVFGSPGSEGRWSCYRDCTGSCSLGPVYAFGSEQVCLLYGSENSGKGASVFANVPPWHPGFPDANYPICNAVQCGTVIVKYPDDFPAAPSFPGAYDCSPQTPGYYTYRFVSPGSITLP